MTKAELIKAVAKKLDTTQKEAREIVDGFTEVLSDSFLQGNRVRLDGLGTFNVVDRAARKGRNPQTGEELEIPARKALTFKPAQQIKDLLN